MGVLAATWGASYLFISVSLDDFSSPFIVFGRTALAALVLVPIAARAGVLRGLRGAWGAIAVLAAMQVAGPFLLIVEGQNHVPSALAGILVASAPIFAALIALVVDDAERMTGWSGVGILTGIVGIVLLFGVDLSGDRDAVLGGAMILLAGFGYALGAFYLKRRLSGVRPAAVAAGTMVVSAAMVAPFALASLPTHAPAAKSVAALLALGMLGTGIAFLLFYSLISEIGPSRAAVVAYLAPGFAVLYGASLLGEALTVATFAGLGLVLAGSYLAAQGRPPWQRAPVAGDVGQPPLAGTGPAGGSAEADLAVGAGTHLGALDEVEAATGGAEEPGDEAQPRVLGP